MKKTIYILATIMTVLTMSSCQDFLTENLQGKFSSETYYTSQEYATMAVNSVYNSLYGNTQWVFGDVASDDAVKGGNAGDNGDLNYIDNFQATSDNGALSTYWQFTYETIARANIAIQNISAMDANLFDNGVQNRLIAEAKFLRAYSYFNLVNIFGEVPLKLDPEKTNVPLSSISDIYAQIESDLTFGTKNLPATYLKETGRATKGAAFGMLAKVDLFQKKYTKCLENIDSLENLKLYGLVKNYANLFKAGAEDSVESIFAIRYANTSDASLGDNLSVWLSPAVEGGYYFDAPTQSFVDCFTDSTTDGKVDPRLDASIGRDGMPWFNDTIFHASWSEATGYLVKKYDLNKIAGYSKSQSTVPQHILRYADVLLMKAEALNETNQSGAEIPLNKVRERAGLAPTTATTQSQLREVIRNERRKELGFEFQRFFDVMRYGKTYATEHLGSNCWSNTRYYFPIPQAELETNGAL